MNAGLHEVSTMRSLFQSVDRRFGAASTAAELGALPQWRLDDLYDSMDSPRFAADLERARARGQGLRRGLARQARRDPRCRRRGRHACRGGQGLRGAAGSDRPGDVLRLAALRLRHQRFGAGEILRRCAGAGDGARWRPPVLRARAEPARRRRARKRRWRRRRSAHYRPWLEDIRKEKPHQLADDHRAAVPGEIGLGRGGLEPLVRRHDVGAPLRFRRRKPDARAAARQAPGPGRGEARGGGERARGDARGESAALRPHHQHARQGQGDLRPLAQVRRRRGFAPSRQPRRAGSGRGAGRRGHRRLSAPLPPLLCAQSPLVRQGQARPLGPQRAAARMRPTRLFLGDRARHGARRLTPASRRAWPTSPADSSTKAGSTRRSGPGRRRALSPIRRRRRRIPMCWSTSSASRAT